VVLIERMNGLMRAIRRTADDLIATDQLDPGLRTFLDEQDLALHNGGIYFAKMYELNGDRTPHDSLTGHEALVNSFHPDEFLGTEQPDWATLNLAQSVLLAREVLHQAGALTTIPVDVVVGIDLGGFGPYPSSKFRFYGRRSSDQWISDDLDDIHIQGVSVLRLAAPERSSQDKIVISLVQRWRRR